MKKNASWVSLASLASIEGKFMAKLRARFSLKPSLAAGGAFLICGTALIQSLPEDGLKSILGQVFILLFIFAFFVFFGGKRALGRTLRDPEVYMLSILTILYVATALFVRNLNLSGYPISLAVPTALVVMIPAILIGSNLALVFALVLPLGVFFAGAFGLGDCFFALVSGAVASSVLEGAEKRMDTVKAGLIIAGINCLAIIAILLYQGADLAVYPAALFWSAFNGLICGMLLAGALPPLEHALNALTPFRLIELSDLNSPILRRLFTVAPGTYSHSLMVANLAETACQDIGANALLARVGAYYHDIGKMEQPEYFVENQSGENVHDHLSPRLSVMVIRSHVKLGVEKAQALGLPREVVDIIAGHHGNSVITWFYNKALQQEESVNVDDFRYPGLPPRSKEAAVVMLADVTEAAVRTLQKPTAAKLEKFIQELIDNKVEQGQLARSDLSFRELSVIKNAFVRVLAGYYHSRIEYPKVSVPRPGTP